MKSVKGQKRRRRKLENLPEATVGEKTMIV
jgi:hypothetical protein